jgi:LDH2 family malate/lactate/ureidoglycolate dehydrogenase
MTMLRFTADQLRALGVKLLTVAGATPEQAETVTDVLVAANLHGIDSHGIRALPGHVRSLRDGRVRPDAAITVVKETLTTAFWEGGHQFGHVVAKQAMEAALRKADAYRMGWVSTVSQHIGALFYYALMAAQRGMIGIVTCRVGTVGGRITPYWGREGRFGTNPLAICIPADKEQPILLDMATSMVADGHLAVMAARGEAAPEGWLIDKEGNPTTDPNDYTRGGFMVPFGTYKGYGLSMIIGLLPMFLPGLDLEAESKTYHWGHTFMALDPAGFMPLQAFLERTDAYIRYIKSCPPLPGREVLVPFEREWRAKAQRSAEGIPVDEPFWEAIVKVGAEIGVDVNEEMRR